MMGKARGDLFAVVLQYETNGNHEMATHEQVKPTQRVNYSYWPPNRIC